MSTELVTLSIDGRTARVPRGTLLVDAAKTVGIEIPVFCSHEKLDPVGVCRMCMVEVEGSRKLVTACTEPVREGMVVRTDTPQVAEARKSVLEFLLINHPLDCPVCDKGGECDLQDLTFRYGPSTSRLVDGKLHKPKAVDLGPFIVLDEERCILCRRCTRFDDQVTQERTLVVGERAHDALITTADGVRYDSVFSGNTIELCPVGALTSRLYRFRARPWDLTRVDALCHGCPVGCHVQLHFRPNVQGVRLDRVISRPYEPIDDGWLCDRGRFNYGFIQSRDRVQQPLVRPQGAPRGKLVPATWERALEQVAARLRATLQTRGPEAVGAVGGGRLTNEEAYLLQKLFRQVLGSGNLDHRVAGEAAASLDAAPGQIRDLDEADVILVVGAQPAQSAPVVDLRIRRAVVRRRALLVSVGAVGLEDPVPITSLLVRPDETGPTVERLARSLSGDVVPAGGRVDGEEGVVDALRGREGLLVAIWDGMDAAAGRAVASLLEVWRSLGREARLLVIGDQANSRGAEAMGLRPDLLPGYRSIHDPEGRRLLARGAGSGDVPGEGLSTAAMLDRAASGALGVLYLVGANLLESYPDRALVEAALASDTFVVAQDLFLTETARLADVVLPVAPFTAREGHLTNLEGRVQPTGPRSTDASAGSGADARTDGEIFQELARQLSARPLVASSEALVREMQEVVPPRDGFLGALPERVLTAPARGAGVPAGTGDGGLEPVALPVLHGGGGTARFDRAYNERRPLRPELLLHPDDAAALGIADGDRVQVEDASGPVDLVARVSRRVAAGVMAVPRGIPGVAWNRITASPRVRLQRSPLEEVG